MDLWSIQEIDVTSKLSKTKPEAGQEKFRQSKPDKPES